MLHSYGLEDETQTLLVSKVRRARVVRAGTRRRVLSTGASATNAGGFAQGPRAVTSQREDNDYR